MNDDKKDTDAEYESVDSLNEILDKDGNPLDAIEQDQSTESEEDSKEELREGIIGDDDNSQDAILDA